jgi:6-phosphofructokinase 1
MRSNFPTLKGNNRTMMKQENFNIHQLGECRVDSPMKGVRFTEDGEGIVYHRELTNLKSHLEEESDPLSFEAAGPRKKLFFDPSELSCGIVTCGGLCPGINDVIRSIVMGLHFHYGVKQIYGFRYGYQGLNPAYGHEPIELTPQLVNPISDNGGTMLASSRGSQDTAVMVDTLERMNIGILFCIGGDGTQRGALSISEEARRRGLKISVIGIPKTIDNDVSFVQKTFGFETAVSEAKRATYAAHTEAVGAPNGIGLVKLMGRDSGFIAAYSVLVDNQVNFCLVPEVPFSMEVFLASLKERIEHRKHAVIVVAEGAGQDLFASTGKKDASGNVKYVDIGLYLRDGIKEHFQRIGMEVNLKYIDPSYIIRSQPANAHDSAFCLLMGHNAVHAGMAGRTGMIVGYWNNLFTHVPISLAVSERKKIDPRGWMWSAVLAATGQPADMT